MNRLIQVEIALYVRDAYGGMDTFYIRSNDIWAEYIRENTGTEGVETQRISTQNRLNFRVHYQEEISHAGRIKYKDKWYEIIDVHEDELNQFTEIEAERREEVFTWTTPASTTTATTLDGDTWAVNGSATETGIYYKDSTGAIWEKQ
jgi:SPP1 family predicted phage head-tail adaptor